MMSPTIERPRLIRILLGVALALTPIYAGSSGGVQPAHLFILLAALWSLHDLLPRKRQEFLLLAYFVYAWFREGFYAITNSTVDGLLPVLHIAFAYIVYCLYRTVFQRHEFLRYGSPWICAATIIALIGVLLLGGGAITGVDIERAIGTFNNANQLGYFGVLIASLALFFWAERAIGTRTALFLVLLCGYLSFLSLSKSAMASVLLVFLALLGMQARRRTKFIAIAAIGLIVIWQLISALGLMPDLYGSDFAAYRRVQGALMESDTSFAVRGYTVLSGASWSDVIFGLGWDGVARLRSGYEVHSTFMAPIAAYGLIGGGLFLAFLIALNIRFAIRRGLFMYIGVLLPSMLYGVAHNGGRTPLFWMLVGAAAYMVDKGSRSRPSHVGGN